MAKQKLILISQSGGNFVTNNDGSVSYTGGEANAVNINQEMLFNDLKLELAELWNFEIDSVSVKYFMPGNRRILINLTNDRDLKRLFDFYKNSVTADVFVTGKEGFVRSASEHNERETVVEPVTELHAVPIALDNTASPPIRKRGRRPSASSPSPASLVNVSISTQADLRKADYETAESPTSLDDTLDPSSDYESPDDSDTYRPSSRKRISHDLKDTPAETVKMRRRMPLWKIGSHGVAIAVTDSVGRRKKIDDEGLDIVEADPDYLSSNEDYSNPLPISDSVPLDELVSSWKDGIVGVGQKFKSVVEFRDTLQKYSIARRFMYRLKKNDSNRVSGRCVIEGCSWRIHASWVQSDQAFVIKKMNESHTCEGESWKSAHPAKSWLVGVIKGRLQASPQDKTRDIAKGIFEDFGLKLNYSQIRRGIEDAREQLQGSYKEAYSHLPRLCKSIIETNPGSIATLITADDNKFHRLFISFQASVCGFQNGCRPLLFLDATSFRSKYHEVFLTATAVDGADNYLPVAFAVVDNDNIDAWKWFLDQLKTAVSNSRSITVVSDRELGLKTSIHEVFENAYCGYSMYHLVEEFKRNLVAPFLGDGRGSLPGHLFAAARAPRLDSFKKSMELIRRISTKAYEWIMQVEPEHWANSSFQGEHYNHFTQDVAEFYANLIKQVHEMPIIQKIEALSRMITELMDNRRDDSSKWSTKLTLPKEEKLREEAAKARGLKVLQSTDTLFEVQDDCNHVINLESMTCTCSEWKTTELPCRHAIAVFNRKGLNAYDYCSEYFNVHMFSSTYDESINPVLSVEKHLDEEGVTVKVIPPTTTPPAGEEKRKERKPQKELKKVMCCTRCKEAGHNNRTCKKDF